jgi:hypothetical protein
MLGQAVLSYACAAFDSIVMMIACTLKLRNVATGMNKVAEHQNLGFLVVPAVEAW